MDILDQLIADTEIWDTEYDDPMAVSEAIETERCGRCGNLVDADTIAVTGPYRTCPPCAEIVRG